MAIRYQARSKIPNTMTKLLPVTFSTQASRFTALAALSAAALAAAFTAQYVYGLDPCVLCLYQRVPFAIAIALCLAGLWLGRKGPTTGTRFLLGFTGLTLAANSVIAGYHTGVERKWWPSFLEGCTFPEFKGNITDVLAQIKTAPVAFCDEIPWTDPVIGLSMANYNVVFCAGLAVLAFYGLTRRT